MTMYKTSIDQAPMFDSDLPGAEGVGFGLLISVKDGAPNFVMERHVIAPGGHGAPHAHDWEQQMYVTAGHGVLVVDGEEHPLRPGDAVLIEAGEGHSFRNEADEPLQMLSFVPRGPGTAWQEQME